jgi:DNA-binding MarR family transcriptional regulator
MEFRHPADQVRLCVSQLLRWGTRVDVRRSMRGPTGQDLSATDTWLLGAIVEQAPLRVGDLAVWQGVDKSTVTPQLRRLEERGLVSRRPDPADRRAVLVSATARGRRVLEEIHAAGVALFESVLAEWSPAEQQQLADLLTRFTDQLVERLAGERAPDDRCE